MTSVRLAPRLPTATAAKPAPSSVAPVMKRPVDGFERKVAAAPLQRGMTGAAVTQLQQKLVTAKFMSLNDFRSGPGVYGPRTEAAVKRLQLRVGLPVTGIANAATQQALASGARFEPVVLPKLSETFDDDVTQPMGSRVA